MMRSLGLAFAVALVATSMASAQPRRARRPLDAAVVAPVVAPAALQQPAPTPPDPPPGGTLCCCRAWSHGWQYSWRDTAACTSGNGTCVSPDHC